MTPCKALVLATLLSAGAAAAEASSAPAPVDPDYGREATLRYFLAAAEAEGDLVSDATLLKALELHQEAGGALDPALRARVEVVRAELAARVDAARDKDPVLLATRLRCLPAERAQAGCEQDLARLAELAGDNGYHHLLVMMHAWARADADAFLRHARLAAEAPDFRHDIEVVFGSVHERLQQAPDDLMPRTQETEAIPAAGLWAMGVAAAVALPPIQYYSQPCRESEGELRGHCLAIADQLLEHGWTGIDIRIAHDIYQALGDPEREARAQARIDQLAWQQQFLGEMEARMDRHQWQAYFDAYAEGGETAAFAEAAEGLGYPLEPPPGWSPPGRR